MIYAVMPEMVCAPHEGENMQYAGIIIHCFPQNPLMNLKTTGLVLKSPKQPTKNP